MIRLSEIIQEIKKLKRNQLKMGFFEYILLGLTCFGLLVNFIFSILVYFVFSQQVLKFNIWIYLLILTMLDILIITISMLWFWNSYSNSYGNIPIPRSVNILEKVSLVINIFNTIIAIFTAIVSTFVYKADTTGKIYIFFFTIQSVLLFAYWGWFISFEDKKMEQSYMRKIQFFADYNFSNISKYETYISSHFDHWVDEYNKNLYRKNSHLTTKMKIKNFFAFDFMNNGWKRNVITNHEITIKNLELIFSDKSITTYEEFCKYRFIIMAKIFLQINKDDANVATSFMLFYWVRKRENVRDFEQKLKAYK